ncbi:hypothetical protein BDB01DRAFT_805883 [Pilobolus umbonatus]|nr:hypothetical protein BDB01DRAFT_805883 [Pilobolus umbonatus]
MMTSVSSTRFLKYILSLIGMTNTVNSSCSFLTDSTCVIQKEDYMDEKYYHERWHDWMGRYKLAFCQLLTTVDEYPQVSDVIQGHYRHYEKNFYRKKKKGKVDDEVISELISIQEQAQKIVHALDQLRPSEQFARASDVADHLLNLSRLTLLHTHSSAFTLLAFLVIAEQSMDAPSEVRQHLFYHAKFGRVIILEMASALKNFNRSSVHLQEYWCRVSDTDWLDILKNVATVLARYDLTWEYGREYQDIIRMAERYY